MVYMLWWYTYHGHLEVVITLLMYESDQTDLTDLHYHKAQSMISQQLMMECGTTLVTRLSIGVLEVSKMSRSNKHTCCFMKNYQLSKLPY